MMGGTGGACPQVPPPHTHTLTRLPPPHGTAPVSRQASPVPQQAQAASQQAPFTPHLYPSRRRQAASRHHSRGSVTTSKRAHIFSRRASCCLSCLMYSRRICKAGVCAGGVGWKQL